MRTPEDADFGTWLKKQRKLLGYTQDELAEMAGCSTALIRKIESGTRRTSKAIADLLLDRLEVPAAMRPDLLKLARTTGSEEQQADPAEQNVATSEPSPAPTPTATNVPVPLTPLIGRHAEMGAAVGVLAREEVRLLTLTGPPGVGKTRLTLELAHRLTRDSIFPDGIYLVELASIDDPALVPAAVARVLNVKESGGRTLMQSLEAYLDGKRLLLILDNFEQVLPAAPALASLLAACPHVKLLVTSREALHVRGEWLFPVTTLPVPSGQTLLGSDVPSLDAYPSVHLFVERAQSVRPDLEITPDNARAIAAICARLDGLPLAIELVAARTRLLPPQALLGKFDGAALGGEGHALALLTGSQRDLPERHRTLRAAIDWSYQQLDAPERKLFARLGVFVGGATLAAVEAVCNAHGDLGAEVLDLLESLLDKSLLRRDDPGSLPGAEDRQEEERFTMLSTIREYAAERLAEQSDASHMGELHAEYYTALAEAAGTHYETSEQLRWVARLDRDYGNVRAALAWSLENGHADMALRMSARLWVLWWTQGQLTEGRRWLREALQQTEPAPSRTRAIALNSAGILAIHQGDHAEAESLLKQSLAMLLDLGEEAEAARPLNNLGWLAQLRGDYTAARHYYEQALDIRSRQDPESWTVALLLHNLARVAQEEGDQERARALYTQSLALSRKLGVHTQIAHTLINLSQVLFDLDSTGEAEELFHEALAMLRELGSRTHYGAGALAGLAGLWSLHGEPVQAARLLGAAEALYGTIGAAQSLFVRAQMTEYADSIRAQLDEHAYAAAIAEGHRMSPEQAIEYALSSYARSSK